MVAAMKTLLAARSGRRRFLLAAGAALSIAVILGVALVATIVATSPTMINLYSTPTEDNLRMRYLLSGGAGIDRSTQRSIQRGTQSTSPPSGQPSQPPEEDEDGPRRESSPVHFPALVQRQHEKRDKKEEEDRHMVASSLLFKKKETQNNNTLNNRNNSGGTGAFSSSSVLISVPRYPFLRLAMCRDPPHMYTQKGLWEQQQQQQQQQALITTRSVCDAQPREIILVPVTPITATESTDRHHRNRHLHMLRRVRYSSTTDGSSSTTLTLRPLEAAAEMYCSRDLMDTSAKKDEDEHNNIQHRDESSQRKKHSSPWARVAYATTAKGSERQGGRGGATSSSFSPHAARLRPRLRVVIGVPTVDTPLGAARRDVQRRSWLRYPQVLNSGAADGRVLVRYLVARHPSHGYAFSAAVVAEGRRTRDVLLLELLEGRPTTAKVSGAAGHWGLAAEVGMSRKALAWYALAPRLYDFDFIAKADDDVFLRVPAYLAALEGAVVPLLAGASAAGRAIEEAQRGNQSRKNDGRNYRNSDDGRIDRNYSDVVHLILEHQQRQQMKQSEDEESRWNSNPNASMTTISTNSNSSNTNNTLPVSRQDWVDPDGPGARTLKQRARAAFSNLRQRAAAAVSAASTSSKQQSQPLNTQTRRRGTAGEGHGIEEDEGSESGANEVEMEEQSVDELYDPRREGRSRNNNRSRSPRQPHRLWRRAVAGPLGRVLDAIRGNDRRHSDDDDDSDHYGEDNEDDPHSNNGAASMDEMPLPPPVRGVLWGLAMEAPANIDTQALLALYTTDKDGGGGEQKTRRRIREGGGTGRRRTAKEESRKGQYHTQSPPHAQSLPSALSPLPSLHKRFFFMTGMLLTMSADVAAMIAEDTAMYAVAMASTPPMAPSVAAAEAEIKTSRRQQTAASPPSPAGQGRTAAAGADPGIMLFDLPTHYARPASAFASFLDPDENVADRHLIHRGDDNDPHKSKQQQQQRPLPHRGGAALERLRAGLARLMAQHEHRQPQPPRQQNIGDDGVGPDKKGESQLGDGDEGHSRQFNKPVIVKSGVDAENDIHVVDPSTAFNGVARTLRSFYCLGSQPALQEQEQTSVAAAGGLSEEQQPPHEHYLSQPLHPTDKPPFIYNSDDDTWQVDEGQLAMEEHRLARQLDGSDQRNEEESVEKEGEDGTDGNASSSTPPPSSSSSAPVSLAAATKAVYGHYSLYHEDVAIARALARRALLVAATALLRAPQQVEGTTPRTLQQQQHHSTQPEGAITGQHIPQQQHDTSDHSDHCSCRDGIGIPNPTLSPLSFASRLRLRLLTSEARDGECSQNNSSSGRKGAASEGHNHRPGDDFLSSRLTTAHRCCNDSVNKNHTITTAHRRHCSRFLARVAALEGPTQHHHHFRRHPTRQNPSRGGKGSASALSMSPKAVAVALQRLGTVRRALGVLLIDDHRFHDLHVGVRPRPATSTSIALHRARPADMLAAMTLLHPRDPITTTNQNSKRSSTPRNVDTTDCSGGCGSTNRSTSHIIDDVLACVPPLDDGFGLHHFWLKNPSGLMSATRVDRHIYPFILHQEQERMQLQEQQEQRQKRQSQLKQQKAASAEEQASTHLSTMTCPIRVAFGEVAASGESLVFLW